MIYKFQENYKNNTYQVVEKKFENRTSAEIYFMKHENELNKIAFKIAGQKMLTCGIEVLENYNIINSLMYKKPGQGIIWIDLLLY